MAQEQLGKPLGEAYQALGLPGNPEDAAEVFYLHAEDCVKVLGKQMDVAIVHLGKDEEDKKLTDEKTNSVEYLALLGGDYAYPLKLYRALREAYGEPEPVTGAQSFSQATEVSLEAMKQSERCANQWKKEDDVIVISFNVGASAAGGSSISLEISLPVELLGLPTISPDGKIIG